MLLSELLCWFNCFIFGLVINYEVSVVTGDVRAAGTNAKVFMQIYGETGKTELITLENRSNNFERGATDIFKVWRRQSLPLLWGERNGETRLRHQQSNWPNRTKKGIFLTELPGLLVSAVLYPDFGEMLYFFGEVLCFVEWFPSSEGLVAKMSHKGVA